MGAIPRVVSATCQLAQLAIPSVEIESQGVCFFSARNSAVVVLIARKFFTDMPELEGS